MNKTIELIKKYDMDKKLKKALDLLPINAVNDVEKDPNMHNAQCSILAEFVNLEMERNKNFVNEFFVAVFSDIVDELALKKEGTGNRLLYELAELMEELK